MDAWFKVKFASIVMQDKRNSCESHAKFSLSLIKVQLFIISEEKKNIFIITFSYYSCPNASVTQLMTFY